MSLDEVMTPTTKSHVDVTISGRDNFEETHWWDSALRDRERRPGPGILPTMLADEVHDPDHSLFSVLVSNPNVNPPDVHLATPLRSNDTSSNLPPSFPERTNAWAYPPSQPPTDSEVRAAVPHANAYYCPKDNGWVILIWKYSYISGSPPYAPSFEESRHPPLPRRRFVSCFRNGPYPAPNKTHHFHKYDNAVNSHKLIPPFKMKAWEFKENGLDETNTSDDDADEGRLLDLYLCCQCSLYCVASGIIPGVIPRKCLDEFVRDKRDNPPVGQSREVAVLAAFETLIKIMEDKLWKGENYLLRTDHAKFPAQLGWSPNTKRTLEILGFTEELLDNQSVLRPPPTDLDSSLGRMNRRRLLRAWVEVNAWLADFKRSNATHFKDLPERRALSVQIESVREMYQTAIGAHPDQIPRGELSAKDLQADQLRTHDWQNLGLTPMSFSADLLAFAYYAQARCDPTGTIEHFTSFSNIVTLLQNFPDCPQSLSEILAAERLRDRFTTEDLQQATVTLGFGKNNSLGVEYNDAVSEQFLENAWKDRVKRLWREPGGSAEMLRNVNEALRMLAETRGSAMLRKVWENGKNRVMTPEKAYDTLEVPKDTNDFMLMMAYDMRTDESPAQVEKLKEAMTVIAEVRDSQRLRQFLSELGRNSGAEPTRPDLPRGLNQLENTFYLNSLLQYFYTIKDLREAVIPMLALDLKSVENGKFSEDDLKRHRVGRRSVTRREIVRSKKFVNELADLFFELEYAEVTAVTPSIDLAELALVTTRDEEEDEMDVGGGDYSHHDATQVDDAPPKMVVTDAPAENARSLTLLTSSVEMLRQPSVVNSNSPTTFPLPPNRRDSLATRPPRQSSDSPPPLYMFGPQSLPEASGLNSSLQADVEMVDALSTKPSPLPSWKSTRKSGSVLMSGKQHDAAECMDNCMFQIETALLKFDGVSETQGESYEKTNVIKRLFYGKLRQSWMTGPQPSRWSGVHEQEDLFSHLPVDMENDGIDIYDGLGSYFDCVVELNGEKQRMEATLVDLPPVLQIRVEGVQFNRETLQPYVKETIYMDRFMDNADSEKKARSKVIQARLDTIRECSRLLVERKVSQYDRINWQDAAMDNAAAFVSKLGHDSDIIDDEPDSGLEDEQKSLKDEIAALRTEAYNLKDELEAVWKDDTEIAYELTSVFIHLSSMPSFGHYFFYSRHQPNNPDSWFKYNDSNVTVVSKDEVLAMANTTGSTVNPYLLVFARKGSEVIDTVKRFDLSILEDA